MTLHYDCRHSTPPATTPVRTIAIFDLDNTLLAGDSDFLWGEFLAEHGLVDAAWRERNASFFDDYQKHRLDEQAYLRFSLDTLRQRSISAWQAWRQRFLSERIRPIIAPGSRDLIAYHRRCGHLLVIATSTNRFVTEPIAAQFGIDHLIATEFTVHGGKFSGLSRSGGCIGAAKLRQLNRWLRRRRLLLARSFAYSDSAVDLPLLAAVDVPVAVDPEPRLALAARRRGWAVISLRDSS